STRDAGSRASPRSGGHITNLSGHQPGTAHESESVQGSRRRLFSLLLSFRTLVASTMMLTTIPGTGSPTASSFTVAAAPDLSAGTSTPTVSLVPSASAVTEGAAVAL